MKIRYICPLWGSESVPFDQFCEQVVEAGYDGVECSVPLEDPARARDMVQKIKGAGLCWVGQHWETTDPNVERHIELFTERLRWLASLEPLFINSQTGRDWFPFEDNLRVLNAAFETAEELGVKIIHETHRGKFSFCAASTIEFIQALPTLRITADFSHWCAVSESLLDDQQDSVREAIARADHIHGRVGYVEGPQVNDPRAPEWDKEVEAHLNWWDQIVETHRIADTDLTISPEFGPFPYMQQKPFTEKPLASQWEINVYMMNLLKERYAD